MASWVRNTIMLVVMLVWSVYIGVSLLRRDEIETIVWGLPGAVYFALNPSFKREQSGNQKAESRTSGEVDA